MTEVLGQTLERALDALKEQGVVLPVIRETRGRRVAEGGELRVVRVLNDGRELTVARFPAPLLPDAGNGGRQT